MKKAKYTLGLHTEEERGEAEAMMTRAFNDGLEALGMNDLLTGAREIGYILAIMDLSRKEAQYVEDVKPELLRSALLRLADKAQHYTEVLMELLEERT